MGWFFFYKTTGWVDWAITLTTAPDNIVGTAGNDTINGYIGAANSTLTPADVINGGAGRDTLNVTIDAAGSALNSADIQNIEVVNVRALAAATVDASQIVGLQEVNLDRGTASLTITNLAKDASVGLIGNGVAALGALTASYVAAATSANISVTGGTGATAAGAVTILDGAGLTSAVITGSNGANTLASVAFGTGPGTADNVKAVTVDAQSNLTTGNITGLVANSTITVEGAGRANIGTLQATNVIAVDASASTGGVTATLNDVTGIKFIGGSGDDIVTTGAVLAGTASVDAGAGTADRLVVANSTHVSAAVGKFYQGFEQLQVQDGVSVDVEHLAAGNTIDTIRINDGAGATTVTNLSAAQAANVQILAANAAGAITIGVKDATVAGQIDTVNAALTTTTAAGVANNIDLTGLTLAGVEKLVLDGNGTVAASTGTVTLTTANAISLDSIILNNAGVNTITIAGAHGATNLVVDASGSTGATTIDASAYNTTTGAQLFGGSGNDFIEGSARSDIINGGAGNDLIGGTAITGTVGAVTAVAASTATDILTGGAGNDTFAIGFVNAFANMSKITDLDLGTNAATGRVDSLIFDQAFAGAATIVTLSTAQQAAVTGAADLAAATVAVLGVAGTAGNVAQFTYGSDTYLLVNGDGNATYDFAADAIINITGVVGTLDASDITLI